ncbi:exported hypothetical protein [Wolbachia endosymbiont of Armadillidium vulgare str. wVulC]|uniref:Uncharacterized protein n=1 Tax=Wolbachia endosymbiont of Armadillidium arcangelii TaxID=3158571 RepID=A0AAU7Q2Q5_9RICK|nr:hypothetical protein [Wolbachia endosymbiont of Armadillidium vulgare]KLT22989.1 exported hypothetical protein [Wolbachia endosymbiont of Armadillidium vulgare str. wVulC]OJH31181.1 hypothetical protein Wxf_00561 [Wolbachia endosymbiont of Armadillidium vulgare]OJH32509.1 hypothetical protein Wxf_01948 [Wolbachia endosymbiont of Armadillidium vulgare]
MFDILKDSNGRFNKKNALPLFSFTVASVLTALSTAVAIPSFFSHPSLSNHLNWEGPSYSEFLTTHIPTTIVTFSILGLCIYLPIDSIRRNKQIENLKANSEPNSYIYNISVNNVSEEQIADRQL